MNYPFKTDPVSNIILVSIFLDEKYEFKMAIDTAASKTTFDFNALHFFGYPVGDITETCIVETAAGIMEVGVIDVKSISAFGHQISNPKVQVYDFLKQGVISNYDGLLGLDFFENTEFIINMKNRTITVNSE
jgi:hypothetical protein